MADKWEAFGNLSDEEFELELEAVQGEIRALLVAKRKSYGPDNLTDFGDTGIVVRTWDKMKRLKRMWHAGVDMSHDGEGARDAWRDVVGYGLLMLVASRMLDARVQGDADPIRTINRPPGWAKE